MSLGGRAYICENDAFTALEKYLTRSQRSLKNDPDAAEILADIEQAIADHFDESKKSEVVSLKDVESVIEKMGNIEANDSQQETKTESDPSESNLKELFKGPLYKDKSNQLIDGVASGIARTFGIDPMWIRLGFCLSSFLWGIGIVAYLVLMILMPDKSPLDTRTAQNVAENVKAKRLLSKSNERVQQAAAGLSRLLSTLSKVVKYAVALAALAIFVLIAVLLTSGVFLLITDPNKLGMIGAYRDWLQYVWVLSTGVAVLVPLLLVALMASRSRQKKKSPRLIAGFVVLWVISLTVAIASLISTASRNRDWIAANKPKSPFLSARVSESGDIQSMCVSLVGSCDTSRFVPYSFIDRCGGMYVYTEEQNIENMQSGRFTEFEAMPAPVTEEQYCTKVREIRTTYEPKEIVVFSDKSLERTDDIVDVLEYNDITGLPEKVKPRGEPFYPLEYIHFPAW
jgi:phage shock protein PspC (stress-responsive transcriptional regulator)